MYALSMGETLSSAANTQSAFVLGVDDTRGIIYDCKLQIAGLHAGHDRTVVRPGSRAGGQSVWYFAGERLLAVDAMTDPKAYMTGKRWLEAGRSPDPALIADPATELRDAV